MDLNKNSIEHIFHSIDMNLIGFLPLLNDFFEGVLITDKQGRVLFINDEQARIDDLSPQSVLGKKVTDIYHVDEGATPTMQCIQSGKPIKGLACYYRTSTGKIVNSIHNIFPLYSGKTLIGAICFVQDFSIIEQRFETVLQPGKIKNLQKSSGTLDADKKKRFKNGTRFRFQDIIGSSKDLLESIELARLASRSPSPVMLFGKTGTGKELMAQSIHNASPRKKEQYVAVNCSAIPENLLEGILFGTSKGAFTGAVDKVGLIEKANGGTLFLDEVNSMSPGLQAKLLRFLQERKVRRVGSLEEVDVDVKVISSINRNPHTAIEKNELRPDFFYRLAVVFIQIPSLSERLSDLPVLTSHFLEKKGKLMGKQVVSVSNTVMNLFRRYNWPGNVRELEHILEGAMNMIDNDETLQLHHLPSHLALFMENSAPETYSGMPGTIHTAQQTSGTPDPSKKSSKKPRKERPRHSESLDWKKNEVHLIKRALQKAKGRPSVAARLLGISPQLLNHRLKKHGIDRYEFLKPEGNKPSGTGNAPLH